jgi:hypothetical protein
VFGAQLEASVRVARARLAAVVAAAGLDARKRDRISEALGQLDGRRNLPERWPGKRRGALLRRSSLFIASDKRCLPPRDLVLLVQLSERRPVARADEERADSLLAKRRVESA